VQRKQDRNRVADKSVANLLPLKSGRISVMCQGTGREIRFAAADGKTVSPRLLPSQVGQRTRPSTSPTGHVERQLADKFRAFFGTTNFVAYSVGCEFTH
jgi:hypothetical protein